MLKKKEKSNAICIKILQNLCYQLTWQLMWQCIANHFRFDMTKYMSQMHKRHTQQSNSTTKSVCKKTICVCSILQKTNIGQKEASRIFIYLLAAIGLKQTTHFFISKSKREGVFQVSTD